MYPPPITSKDFGIAGRSSAVVELSNLLLSIFNEGIVAILEPVAITILSKVSLLHFHLFF